MLRAVLTGLLFVLLSASPACAEQVHFSWPSSSFPDAHDGELKLRVLAWVSPERDAFVIALAGDRVFVGRRAKVAAVKNVVGWKVEQTELRLPVGQGGARLGAYGVGDGCEVASMGRDLGGPIAGSVVLDARTKWRFELRDRSMKEVLLSF